MNYSVDAGTGTIDPSTGVYNTTQSGPATIKVTDAQNTSQTITINNKKIRFDGRVRAMVQASTSLYVGGDFTNVHAFDAPKMMVLDVNGKPKYGCDLQSGFNDKVRAIATSGNSVYVGGYFTQYRGQSANYLAKLKLPSCELDTTFSPPAANGFSAVVHALAVSGSSLYVGGEFTSYKGVASSARRVAKLDLSDGTLDTTFSPPGSNGFGATVYDLAVSGLSLYVGGAFTSYRGVANAARRVAKLDLSDGTLDTTFSPPAANGFNNGVYALAVAGASLYVGGEFTDYRGVVGSANYVAKLNLTSGELDANFSPPGANGFNNTVDGLAVSDLSLYAGGDFTDYRGEVGAANKVAKLDLTSGALDTTFSPPGANGFDADVHVLAVAGSSLYLGGNFSAYKGAANSANRIAKLDLNTGALDTTFSPPAANGFNGTVSALKVAGSTLYAGGSFSAYKGGTTSANRIAKLDLNTGALDTTFSPPAANGFNDDVQALAVAGSSLYVGGAFTDYRGVVGAANRIAKLDLTSGALDTTFSPPGANGFNNTGNIVYALAVSGTSLYVGGWFADYRGVVDSARKIAKLDLTSGALDTTFHPPGSGGFNYEPYALAVSGTSLYVGGYFTSYRGVANSAKRIAKLNLTDGTLDTAFSPPASNGFNSWVNTLAISGSSLYVGGEFNDYRDSVGAANKIAKLDLATGALDTTFSPPGANGFDARLDAIVVSGSSLYVGGLFTAYKGVANSANYVAKLDLTTGALDTTFSPPAANGFNNRVRSLLVSGTTLYAGGDFLTYRGTQNARYLVPLDLITGALGDP